MQSGRRVHGERTGDADSEGMLDRPACHALFLIPNRGLKVDARQQKHRNKHKGRGCQRQIHYFRYDIGKNIALGHGRLPKVHPTMMIRAVYGTRGSHLRECNRNLSSPTRQVKRGSSGQARPLPLSSPAGSASHRILDRFAGSVEAPINASR